MLSCRRGQEIFREIPTAACAPVGPRDSTEVGLPLGQGHRLRVSPSSPRGGGPRRRLRGTPLTLAPGHRAACRLREEVPQAPRCAGTRLRGCLPP